MLLEPALSWTVTSRVQNWLHEYVLRKCAVTFVPAGVVLGWLAHARLDQKQLTGLLYFLLVAVSLKMLWSALT